MVPGHPEGRAARTLAAGRSLLPAGIHTVEVRFDLSDPAMQDLVVKLTRLAPIKPEL